MNITYIGKDEQGTFGVVCTPQLAKAKIDGVEERGAPLGNSQHHAALQIFHTVGERTGQFSALVEADEEKFILGIGGLEELNRGLARFADFVGHTPAKIKNNHGGDGHVFSGKLDNFLFDCFFEDAEIVGFQAGDQAVVRIRNGDVDERQVHVKMNGS